MASVFVMQRCTPALSASIIGLPPQGLPLRLPPRQASHRAKKYGRTYVVCQEQCTSVLNVANATEGAAGMGADRFIFSLALSPKTSASPNGIYIDIGYRERSDPH
jgi:hypothetical protein